MGKVLRTCEKLQKIRESKEKVSDAMKKRYFKKIFRDWWKDFSQPLSKSSWRSRQSVSQAKKYEPSRSFIASGEQEDTKIAELVKVCR